MEQGISDKRQGTGFNIGQHRQRGGQLLLEVLIALTILGLVAVAVVRVSTRSVKSSRVAGDRKVALDYAKEKLQEVENEKTNDVVSFFSGSDGTVNCGPLGVNNMFACEIVYDFNSPPDSESVEVEVNISWETSSISLNKIFTKTKLW